VDSAAYVIPVAAGALLLVWLSGHLIPREHRTSASITLPHSAERVWDVITDYAAQPTWHPDIEFVERLDDGATWARWRERQSRDVVKMVRELESDPPRRVVWSFDEARRRFHALWDVELRGDADATRVTITQFADIASPWTRVIALLLRRTSPLTLYLGSLETRLNEPCDGLSA